MEIGSVVDGEMMFNGEFEGERKIGRLVSYRQSQELFEEFLADGRSEPFA